MNIDFSKIEENDYPNFKGGEGKLVARMYVDETIRYVNGYLPKGSTIGVHTHETNSETIYVFSGTGKVIYDGVEIPVAAGSCHYCPKGHTHTLINTGDEELRFLGIIPEL